MLRRNASSKIKVLQVNKLYAPCVGGIERVVQDIAEGLSDKVDMEILVCKNRGIGVKEQVNGVKLIRASSLGIFWSMPISLSFPFILSKKSKHVDIIHFHFPFPLADIAYLLMGCKKSKVVVTYHCDIVRQQKVMRFYKPLMDRFFQHVDKILVTSPNMITMSRYLVPYRDKCVVVPLSIDLKKYTESDVEAFDLGVALGEKLVLYVGRLTYYKGVEYLLEAMLQVDAKLLIVGDGALRSKLEQKTRLLGLEGKVIFLGNLPQKKLNYCYSRCDVFVLPSIEPSEAFGIVQMEAMAYGKPVVNTNLPTGVPYVSKHGETGLTVPPKDTMALADAINRILNDEKLANRFSQNAIKRVNKKFSREKMLEKIYTIYDSLVT